MRDEVLEFLRQNQGDFVSGQDMSEACHVSRTAIWKHIKALRQKGYKIESYTKRGYRLLEEPDLLSPLAMKQILNTDIFGKRYVYMDTTESTNLEARRLAQQGAEEGTVVVTEEQAAGRGRLSRGWYSPFGKGLWFSLILRPDVKTKQEELPEEIKQIATSLLMEGVDIERTEAFKIILEELEHQYYDVLDSGFEDTLNEWRKLSVTLNQEIEVRAPGNTYEGVATDIDDDGNLLVKTTNGEVKRIVAGDVSIRPRK